MSQQPSPVEAMMAFWKDAMSRMGPAAAPGATPSSGGGVDPLGWMPTPDQVRRMQSGFLEAMAQASDQYMRSPQFVEAMKSSLDSALQARRQVEEFVRRNMADSVSSGSAAMAGGAEIVAVLREMESRINARLDELAARIDGLDAGASTAPAAGPNGGSRPRRSDRG